MTVRVATVLTFAYLLIPSIFANGTDFVSIEAPPDEAVIEVYYSPAKGTLVQQVAMARSLFESIRQGEQVAANPRIKLTPVSYQPGRPGKSFSSPPASRFVCEVVIALSTGTATVFWENSRLVAGVIDAIESLGKGEKGLNWLDPKFRLKDFSVVDALLTTKASERVYAQRKNIGEKLFGSEWKSKLVGSIAFQAPEVVRSSVDSVKMKMQFVSTIDFGHLE